MIIQLSILGTQLSCKKKVYWDVSKLWSVLDLFGRDVTNLLNKIWDVSSMHRIIEIYMFNFKTQEPKRKKNLNIKL